MTKKKTGPELLKQLISAPGVGLTDPPKKEKEPRREVVIYMDQSASMGYFPVCGFEGSNITNIPMRHGSYTALTPVLEHASRNPKLKRMLIITDGAVNFPFYNLKASKRGLLRLKKVSVTFLSLYPMCQAEMDFLTDNFSNLGMKKVQVIGLGG